MNTKEITIFANRLILRSNSLMLENEPVVQNELRDAVRLIHDLVYANAALLEVAKMALETAPPGTGFQAKCRAAIAVAEKED